MTAKERAKRVYSLFNIDFSQITDALHRKIVYTLLLLAIGGVTKLMFGQGASQSKADAVALKTDSTKMIVIARYDTIVSQLRSIQTANANMAALFLEHISADNILFPQLKQEHINDSNRIEDVAFAVKMLKYDVQEIKHR